MAVNNRLYLIGDKVEFTEDGGNSWYKGEISDYEHSIFGWRYTIKSRTYGTVRILETSIRPLPPSIDNQN